MAVQVVELPTQPTPMGYADLGNAFQEAAQGYVAEKDKDKAREQLLSDEAKRRQNALDDLQSSRDYQDQRDAKNRSLDRSDEDYRAAANERVLELHKKGELRDHIAEALVNAGYLDPEKVDDQSALQAAWVKAQHDGLIARYSDMINHGDLSIDDIGDQKKVAEAQTKAAARSQAAVAAGVANKQAGVDAAGSVQSQLAQEQAKVDAMTNAVQQATSNAQNPPAAEVSREASRIATEAAGGKPPSRAQIQQSMDQAAQTVSQKYQQLAAQLDAQAKVVIPEHLKVIQGLEARAQQFEKQNIFGDPDAPAPAPAGTQTLSSPAPSAAGNKAAVLGSLFGRPAPAPAAAGAATPPAPGQPAPAPTPASVAAAGTPPTAAPAGTPAPAGGFPDLTTAAADALGTGAGHVANALTDVGTGAEGAGSALVDRIRQNTNLLGGNPTPGLTPLQATVGEANQLKTQIAVILKQNPNADVSALRQKLTAAQMKLQALQKQTLATSAGGPDTNGQAATLSPAGQPITDATGSVPASQFAGGGYWSGDGSGPQ
jgi:hypothetical protein